MSGKPDGDLLQDPYASSGVPNAPLDTSALGPAFGSGWSSPRASPEAPVPDFLFPENFDEKYRRPWGERLTYYIGVGYLGGLVTGGVTGAADGLRSSAGERRRIRINSVLNATGKRGPAWGNGAGCIAMMFSMFETAAYTFRETDDLLNTVAAGALTGGIFKSTAGPKAALGCAAGLSAAFTALTVVQEQLNKRR